MTFGYCRISTAHQSIDRQVRNILEQFPEAKIIQEVYTGTKITGRPEFDKLQKKVKSGDTVIFDSVSRMSRTAQEGMELWEQWFSDGVNMVFLKEPYCNSDTYRNSMKSVPMTDTDIDVILQAINLYLVRLAKEQIRLAFLQSEKEVLDLRQRTSEGIETARREGKQIGQVEGKKLHVKKRDLAEKVIIEHSRTFGGTLSDKECIELAGVSEKTYYLYKRELMQVDVHQRLAEIAKTLKFTSTKNNEKQQQKRKKALIKSKNMVK